MPRSLAREVAKITWPMLISEISESVYSIVDTFFVSFLGTEALAAVGASSYLSWLFFVIIALFSTGLLVVVSQSYGAGEVNKARKALGEAIIVGVLVTTAISIAVYFFAPFLLRMLLGNNPEVVKIALSYFSIRILGLPLQLIAMSMDSTLRAVGATRYSMIAVIASTASNTMLDPILILGLYGLPKLGVRGAALATILAITLMIPIELFFLDKTGILPILGTFSKPLLVTRIFSIGLPAALERAIFALGNNVYIGLIARCGEEALAAHHIGVRIESFIYMPGFAFSIAAASLVGQKIGAGNVGEAKKVGWEATKLAVIIMTVMGISIAVMSHYLVKPFAPEHSVAVLASTYLILAGLSETGLALAMTISGSIRGGGNTLVPMLINAAGLYLFRIVPATLLVPIYGAVGAWIAMFVDVYMRGLILSIMYSMFFEKLAKKIV